MMSRTSSWTFSQMSFQVLFKLLLLMYQVVATVHGSIAPTPISKVSLTTTDSNINILAPSSVRRSLMEIAGDSFVDLAIETEMSRKLTCRGLSAVGNSCPFNKNIRIDVYNTAGSDKPTTTTTGRACRTFANEAYSCVVTLSENGQLSGIKKEAGGLTHFEVDACEEEGGGESKQCVTFDSHAMNATAEDEDLYKDDALFPPEIIEPYQERDLQTVDTNNQFLDELQTEDFECHSRFNQMTTFYIGLSVGSHYSKRFDNNVDSILQNLEAIMAKTNIIYIEQLHIKLEVRHIEVILSPAEGAQSWDNPGCQMSLDETLDAYTASPMASDQGLWHLFDDCYKAGSGSGIGKGYIGALCYGPYRRAITFYQTTRPYLTTAHELGHNFGSPHTFAPDSMSSYGIMDYGSKIWREEHQFSTHSRAEVCKQVEQAFSFAYCRGNWDFNAASAQCGNGAVEAGEECECAEEGEMSCDCCRDCKLREKAECDAIHSDCCDASCRFKPVTASCEATDGLGYCRKGVCESMECEYYGRGSFCGVREDNPCIGGCMMHSRSSCDYMQNILDGGHLISWIRNGARCSTEEVEFGECTRGVCEAAVAPSPPSSIPPAVAPSTTEVPSPPSTLAPLSPIPSAEQSVSAERGGAGAASVAAVVAVLLVVLGGVGVGMRRMRQQRMEAERNGVEMRRSVTTMNPRASVKRKAGAANVNAVAVAGDKSWSWYGETL